MRRAARYIALAALACLQPTVHAATITARSLDRADVQAAIDRARDGDTVRLPAGSATWTAGVTVAGKHITIAGAGTDHTTIVSGNYPPSTGMPTHRVFDIGAKPGGLTRLTALTIDGGAGAKDDYNKGSLAIAGASTTWRVDHIRLRATRTCGMQVMASGGVIDHCRFEMVGWFFAIYGFNGGGQYGDAAWTEPMPMGSATRPFFVEDCEFVADASAFALDGWCGERVVFRHNTLRNAVIGNHGTETSQRLRGARSFEFHDNTFHFVGRTFYCAIELRSGNGVIYNNSIQGDVTHPIRADNYRDHTSFQPWGIATGESPFDKNDLGPHGKPIVYETGAHSGAANARSLVCTGKTWKPDQWRGYSVFNGATGKSSMIMSNTADTLAYRCDERNGDPNLLWNPGDAFRIERCLAALDQTGRGKGRLISGDTPQPAAWPQQEPEPTYAWGNTFNGKPCPLVSGTPHIRDGVDILNGRRMPGYKPYAYPHPLAKE